MFSIEEVLRISMFSQETFIRNTFYGKHNISISILLSDHLCFLSSFSTKYIFFDKKIYFSDKSI